MAPHSGCLHNGQADMLHQSQILSACISALAVPHKEEPITKHPSLDIVETLNQAQNKTLRKAFSSVTVHATKIMQSLSLAVCAMVASADVTHHDLSVAEVTLNESLKHLRVVTASLENIQLTKANVHKVTYLTEVAGNILVRKRQAFQRLVKASKLLSLHPSAPTTGQQLMAALKATSSTRRQTLMLYEDANGMLFVSTESSGVKVDFGPLLRGSGLHARTLSIINTSQMPVSLKINRDPDLPFALDSEEHW